MSCDDQKKIKKIPGIRITPRSSFTFLYLIFTPVYSGITLTLLGTAKFFPYVTQIDHTVAFQTSHVTHPRTFGLSLPLSKVFHRFDGFTFFFDLLL
jgi:hypothetical protein